MSNRKNSGYFDNCAICDAMRKADEEGRDLSMSDLRDAFEETASSSKAVALYVDPMFRRSPDSTKGSS